MTSARVGLLEAGLRRIEHAVLLALPQHQSARAFAAWQLRARRDAELRRGLRKVVYRMLMGRLAGAFDSWRNMASQLAHERHLVQQSVARLQHMVRTVHGICKQ